MFICLDCGHVFDEPDTWNEHHPYGEGHAAEAWCGCPRCGGSFEEAKRCSRCDNYFSRDELEDGMCNECHIEEFGEDE